MSTIIESIEQRQLRKDIPRFKAGDTVRVHFQVIEGTRRRVQVFEGVVIKRQGSGARETFTVRKQSFGVGVERTFPVHSPKIEKIEVGAVGDVNRAKLYYLREKVGKKARVRELRQTPAQVAATKAEAEAAKAAIAADAADAEAAAAAEAEAVEAEAAAAAEATAEIEAAAAADLEPVEVEEAPEEPVAEAERRPRPSPRPRRGCGGRARGRPTTRPLTRSRSALFLTAFALVAAGCGAEDAQQEAAREEVQAHVRALGVASGYDAEDVHCTDARGVWFRDEETDEFTCAVRRIEGGCDWFVVHVDRERQRVTVALDERDAGCVLGF